MVVLSVRAFLRSSLRSAVVKVTATGLWSRFFAFFFMRLQSYMKLKLRCKGKRTTLLSWLENRTQN